MSATKAESEQFLKTAGAGVAGTWVSNDEIFRHLPPAFKDDLRSSQQRAIEDSIRRGLVQAAQGRVVAHDEFLDEE